MMEAEVQCELDRLRKRIERERRARQEAEALAERGTRLLYERGQELQLLYVIADACGRAATIDEALQVALDEICAYTSWPVGHAYRVENDPTHPLVPTALWHLDDADQFAAFRAATEKTRFRRDEGLPGQVLKSGGPVWISDVTQDGNFPRAPQALESGMRGGFAIPVMVGSKIVAVLEFFSRELAHPETGWLEVMARIGIQVGRTFEREARDEAEEANRAKSEFLSRMSHELRTPLNAIIGFSQLLEMGDVPATHRERAGYIHRAGRHLLELINEVLDISRIETGRLEHSLEPVQVCEALHEAVDLVQPLAVERSIHVTFAGNENAQLHVRADRQRLKQVLLNLLANAVKYNRERGTVVLRCEEGAAGQVRIAIADSGAGIAPEKRSRLFMPFERLGAEQTTVQGTGLGLALSKRFAEAMGGTLGFESEIGRGSTFWIDLPRATSAVAPGEIPGGSTVVELNGAKVTTLLYIEDNISNLTLIEHVVRTQSQLRLISAVQGELGLDLARQHRPDVILLDVHLPDIDGAEVLRRLRAEATTRDIPVIVLSADATTRQMQRLRDAGANEYLTKPLDVKRFFEVVRDQTRERAKLAATL